MITSFSAQDASNVSSSQYSNVPDNVITKINIVTMIMIWLSFTLTNDYLSDELTIFRDSSDLVIHLDLGIEELIEIQKCTANQILGMFRILPAIAN